MFYSNMKGLKDLSPLALGQPKILLLKQFLQTLPLRDSHFRAAVTAITEMDIDNLQKINDHFLDVYLDKLSHYASNCYTEDSPSPPSETERFSNCDFTDIAVQELGKRRLQVTLVTATETAMDVLSKITGKSNWNEVEATAVVDQQQNLTMSM